MTDNTCKRCHGRYGDPHILGNICGTCADDLRGEPTEQDAQFADHENEAHQAAFDECPMCQRTPSRVRGDR